jgi:hypothetical protein
MQFRVRGYRHRRLHHPLRRCCPSANAQQLVAASHENVAIAAPLSRSQTLRVLSQQPETARRPSGVTARATTELAWPPRVCKARPLSRSQTLRVLSDASQPRCDVLAKTTAHSGAGRPGRWTPDAKDSPNRSQPLCS